MLRVTSGVLNLKDLNFDIVWDLGFLPHQMRLKLHHFKVPFAISQPYRSIAT
jgi:hypothetical protein